MALSTQTKYISVIIQQQKQPLNFSKLDNWLQENTQLYAYITHDKDTYENGTAKGVHTHIKAVLNDSANAPRLSTTLNSLSNYLCMSTDSFTIERMESIEASIQYLIHKNDKEKAQYEESSIHTNLTQEVLTQYLYAEIDSINLDRLLDTCKRHSRSKISIMKEIGLRYYMKYRSVIADICYEYEIESLSSGSNDKN